jgi:hypothetical protein
VDFRAAVDWVHQAAQIPSLTANSYPGYYPIAARYGSHSGQSIPWATWTCVDYHASFYDPHNLVTTGASWVFTCPADGMYLVTASLLFTATTTWAAIEATTFAVYKNGVLYSVLDRPTGLATGINIYQHSNGSDIVPCAIGDTLSIWVHQDSGAALALFADNTHSHVAIAKLPW